MITYQIEQTDGLTLDANHAEASTLEDAKAVCLAWFARQGREVGESRIDSYIHEFDESGPTGRAWVLDRDAIEWVAAT